MSGSKGPAKESDIDSMLSKNADPARARILLLGNKADMVLKNRGELLRHWCTLGHEVHAAAPDLPDAPVSETLREWGVKLHHVDLDRRSRNPLVEVASFHSIYRLCREIAPSHLLAYTIKPSIYGPLAASLAGVPLRYCIITGVGFVFASTPKGRADRAVRAVLRRFDRMAKARCAVVFYQNPDDLELLRDHGVVRSDTRVARLPGSGVNLLHFAPFDGRNVTLDTKAAETGHRNAVFTMVARFLADKGIREYVAAARQMRALYPSTCFRLIGGLDVNPEAISSEEVASWSEDIQIVDWVEDVRPYLTAGDVFVLPSYREGTPKSVLEAMAMGLAIITTDAPGCRETIDDGVSGILVPPRDVPSLVAAMERFVTAPGLATQMGREARAKAERVFDVNIVVDTITRNMEIQNGPSDTLQISLTTTSGRA